MLHPSFLRPRYGGHCFADIPPTVQWWLTGDGAGSSSPALADDVMQGFGRQYDAVVLLWIDAFGWHFFQRYAERYPVLQRFLRDGHVKKLTSQFPSTTTAHATTVHTGLPVAQHGAYEWQYWEPTVNALIKPLMYAYAEDDERGTLAASDIPISQMLPRRTIYRELAQRGVTSTVFQSVQYARSPYSTATLQGASLIPFVTLPEALTNLSLSLAHAHNDSRLPAYFFLYFDKIDGIAHHYGPNSPHFHAEVDACLSALEWFFANLPAHLPNTLFLLTADHGQTVVDPSTTLYLNRDSRFRGLPDFLRPDAHRGKPALAPGGSCRDAFLYVREGLVDEAQAFLQPRLGGVADVIRTRDLIEAGYFGPGSPGERLRSRIGDLVILPYAGQSVWWYERDVFEMQFYGMHGGLSPEEMEIPLAMLEW